jgi:hypothetical protein
MEYCFPVHRRPAPLLAGALRTEEVYFWLLDGEANGK